MVYDFEQKQSNITDYLNKTVIINEIRFVEINDKMRVTELTLDTGEVISTTSNVIHNQAKKLQLDNKLPFRAKIVKAGDDLKYYTFSKPE